MTRLNSVQLLRALAVILVVHAHAIDTQKRFGVSWQQNFYFLENFGCIGADIFFVISGFIISYVYNNDAGGLKYGLQFLKRRFQRINPVYYILSTFTLLLIFTLYKDPDWPNTMPQLVDVIFMIPVLKYQAGSFPLIPVGWTLGIEWWFYILFFLVILTRTRYKIQGLFALISLLVIARFVFKPADFRLQFITSPLMLEFLSGVVIFWIYKHLKVSLTLAWILSLLAITGLVINIFHDYGTISEADPALYGDEGMKRVLLWGIPSALLVSGCIFLEKNGVLNKLWSQPLGLFLGGASYSIYLIHYPVIAYITPSFFDTTGITLSPDVSVFIYMLLGIIAGALFYTGMEKPLLEYMHPTASRRLSSSQIQADSYQRKGIL